MTSVTQTTLQLTDTAWVSQLAEEFQAKHDAFVIVRVQMFRQVGMAFKNGRLDGISDSATQGMGVQIFNRDGESVLGSSNDVQPEELRELLERTYGLLRSAHGRLESKNTEIWTSEPLREERIVETALGFEAIGFESAREALRSHHEQMRRLPGCDEPEPNLSVTSSLNIIEEEWLIVRGDGGRVYWNAPRCSVSDSFTARGGKRAASTRHGVHERDLRVLLDPTVREETTRHGIRFRALAMDLRDAEPIDAGSYKLVIDSALSKGLAHEAFGHAAESDAVRFESILGEKQRYRTGLRICRDAISIVDSSVEGDWAYAPYSANGLRRQSVAIVENGILKASLADIYSARSIGVSPTGAARVESYADVPLPRMSNIRLEIKDSYPWDDPENYDPEAMHRFLLQSGLMKEGEEVLYLSGYRGGQVNPKLGDYVFNCQAIYRFKDGQTTMHQPALFAGRILETLESILAGIGPMHIHHLGTCGKSGQGVPSSGGGPMFTVIDKHPAITIGGR